MRIFILFSFLFFGAAIDRHAQRGRMPSGATETRQAKELNDDTNRRFEALKKSSESPRRVNISEQFAALQKISDTYRNPNKKESKLLAPSKEDLKKYAVFLDEPKTGITKLIADKGCAGSPNVVYVSEECQKYSMPGAGTSFSFRTHNHRIQRLSDLSYDGRIFHTSGIMTHSILVNLGDTPLENISLQSNGMKFLTDFQTATDFDSAVKKDNDLINGIKSNEFFYSRRAEVKENETYALRVIAYRGNVLRALDRFVYDEFDYDERRDLTVVFRVVRRDAESVTILWKIISNQKAPVMKKHSTDQLRLDEKFTAKTE